MVLTILSVASPAEASRGREALAPHKGLAWPLIVVQYAHNRRIFRNDFDVLVMWFNEGGTSPQ